MPRPPEPRPTFFIDHCLGTEKVAQRLRQEGFEARVLIEEGFAQDTDDVDWLPAIAARGWAILTKDKRVRRRPLEHRAILASGAGAFVLTARGLGGDGIAEAFARALPRMVRIWHTRTRPFIATVSAHGVTEVVDGGARKGGVRRG